MAGFKLDVADPDSLAQVHKVDMEGFDRWSARTLERTPYIIGRNNIYSQNQVQWGHKAGVNTGNGLMEGSMSADTFMVLGETMFKDDPNWYQDDKKFYKFLREHPWCDARPGKAMSRGEKIAGG